MSKIKVGSLNCGRGLKHFEETRTWIQQSDADLLFLQDVQMRHLRELLQGFECSHFTAMCKHPTPSGRQEVGIAVCSRATGIMGDFSVRSCVGEVLPVMDLQGVATDAEGNATAHTDLRLIRATESRPAIFVKVLSMRIANGPLIIGTTHGPWVKGGQPDEHQFQAVTRLGVITAHEQADVMMGDFNFSRLSPTAAVHELFLRTAGMIDCVPPELDNTLDPEKHAIKGKFKVVSDSVFVRAGLGVRARDVKIEFGVSDHGALTAILESEAD